MIITVTGGAGFIGSNLCRHLTQSPSVSRVVALDDLSTGHRDHLEGVDVDLIEGSITDPAAVDAACDGADAIVHLGALGSVPRSVANPVASHHANATGTIEVLEGARRHGGLHTIVASSSSVYGSIPELPKHEGLATRPMSPYAASKLATEWYALAYQESLQLPVLAFRFFNVYGPMQRADHAYAPVIPAFTHAALTGTALTVHGDGLQTRDFTFVDTVCATIVDALERRVTHHHPVNLAFGDRVSLIDMIEALEELLGTELNRHHTERRTGDMPHTQADPSILRRLFPDIEPIAFPDGLARTLEWHRSILQGTITGRSAA